MKYADFGTVSHCTLRDEDLLVSFADCLEDLVQRNAAEWCSDEGRKARDAYLVLVNEAREAEPEGDESGDVIVSLSDALNEFAPPYAYFGANEGDGSDFGFWLGDMDDFDGLRVTDISEIPNDYTGEVFHVNDHGNGTLYVAEVGKLTCIWSAV